MGKGGLVSYDNTDLFRLIFRIEGSIFDNIFPKVIASVIISFFAAILRTSLNWFEDNPSRVGVPPVSSLAFIVTGSAIAFLLVFRSVISYNRFWEGRGHLGALMENARDFARQAAFCVRLDDGPADVDKDIGKVMLSHVQRGETQEFGPYVDALGVRKYMQNMHGFRRLQMCRQLVLFWRLTVQHLRDQHGEDCVDQLWYNHAQMQEGVEYLGNTEKFIARKKDKAGYNNGVPKHINDEIVDAIGRTMPGKTVVTPHVADMLKGKSRRPLVIIAMLSWYLKQEYSMKNITYMEYLSMNKDLSEMIEAFNGVDKVHNVPIPFPYAQMITLLMSLYCFLAPFMFVQYFHYWTFIPATFLTCAQFGINEVAIEIEDPFGTDENDLPLDTMGDALAADCEMNLEVALVPTANIKQYWEEIAMSRQHYVAKHNVEVERKVAGGTSSVNAGILPTTEYPQAEAEPEPEPEAYG